MGLELRAETPQSLLHFRRPEEIRVLFAVCPVRHDHLPVPVVEQQPHGGIEGCHAEVPGNHPFGVEAAQHAGNVAAAHQRDGENQAVSRLVVHHGLPVHRDGKVFEGAVRQNVAQDGFPVDGDHAYGDARFHAAKLPQETLLGLVAGGGLQTAGRQGEHGQLLLNLFFRHQGDVRRLADHRVFQRGNHQRRSPHLHPNGEGGEHRDERAYLHDDLWKLPFLLRLIQGSSPRLSASLYPSAAYRR